MADIVQSLFGLTPEAYQQQQAAAADRMALEYARMDPLQSARFAIGRGAYQLAGALGGQDPMLQLISNRQAIAREIDPNDLDTYKAGILRLRDANDPVGAMQLMQVLQERLKSTAEIGRLEAAAQASRAQAARERVQQTPAEIAKAREVGRLTTALQTPELSDLERMGLEAELASLRPEPKEKPGASQIQVANELANQKLIIDTLRNQPQSPERDAALNRATYTAEGLERQLQQPREQRPVVKEIGVAKDTGAPVLLDEQGLFVYKDVNGVQTRTPFSGAIESKTPKTEVKLTQQQEKGINVNKVKLAGEVETGALSANDRITLARNMRALLPTAFTGLGSDVKLQASRVAEAFGIPVTGTNESQIIDQILGQMTIGAAGQLKGALSDKDREFLKQTIGTRGLTRATLEFVAQRIERDARVDSELNDAVNAWQSSGKSLNEFNFVRARSEAANKVDAEIKRLEELRRKQRGG